MTAIIDGTNGVTTPNVLTSSSGVALTLQSAGTTAITVSTSQNVGIGTTLPTSLLQVEGSFSKNTGDETTWGIRANDLTAMAAGVGGGLIFTGKYTTGGSNGIFGGIAGTKDNGTSGSGAGNLKLYSANSSGINVERIRLNSVGTVILQGGTTTSDGIGINFPATQSTSSDANTLDDYEEGTWTPTFALGGGSVTYTTRTGTYTKVGRLVTVQILIVVNTASSPSITLEITSLPFNVNADSKGAIAIWSAGASGSATTAWAGTPTPSTNNLRIYIYAGGTVSNPAALIVNGASFYVTASYEAA